LKCATLNFRLTLEKSLPEWEVSTAKTKDEDKDENEVKDEGIDEDEVEDEDKDEDED
jgi:hypothetical protein